MALDTRTVRTLLREAAFNHPVSRPRLLETHISWVVLTGEYAYKIKKPVDYGFLDFSTLERRKHFCEEEVRLNRRFAPGLYLEVVPIVMAGGGLAIGSAGGEAVDYAVRMRQFDDAGLLSRELETGRFGPAEALELGRWLASLHGAIEPRPAPATGGPGSPESFLAALRQNFEQIRPRLHGAAGGPQLSGIEDWSLARYGAVAGLLRERAAAGFVRELHGDLHLRNIVRLEGRLVAFDCIEFNEHFRVLDVQAELALLVMDIERRGKRREAAACFNAYLEQSGDYEGVASTDLFRSYYALVRAKVALLEAKRPESDGYLGLASGYGRPREPALWLMHGLSASGKSTVAAHLLMELDAVRVRSDVERKRLFRPSATERRGEGAIQEGIYAPVASDAVYDRLAALAGTILRSGRHCVVDAAFLEAAHRRRFLRLAESLGVPCRLVTCEASAETLRARVAERLADAAEASEAGPAVLEHQLAHHEPLDPAEMSRAIVVDTTTPDWRDRIGGPLARLLPG